MIKYCVIFFIFNCFYISSADTQNISTKFFNIKSDEDLIYNFLVTLLKTCNFDTKKLIIFDDIHDLEVFTTISEIQPQMSVKLFTVMDEWNERNRYQYDDLKIDAIIIIIRPHLAWNYMNFFSEWRYNRDCIIYIFPEPIQDCASYRDILGLIMNFYFLKAYFICSTDRQTIFIATQDPYGDIKPPYWDKIDQGPYWKNNWTFYARPYPQGSIMRKFCYGFNFERTDPSNQKFLVFGLHKYQIDIHIRNYNQLLNHQIEQYLNVYHKENIACLKKLLNFQFSYYIIKPINETKGEHSQEYDNFWVNGIFVTTIASSEHSVNIFYPIVYDYVAIISHNRGFMTPPEKIAEFYGKWMLSSLIIIIIIAFIVMWFSTKRLNLAAFNILRLLTNTQIIMSTNTWSLKLFFSMIFLYFLVMHATFSGHLAEFLTKVRYRSNIDTVAQLKDPGIKKIYYIGYQYDEAKEFDILRQKSEIIYKTADCKQIISQPKSVCIAPMTSLKRLLRISKGNSNYSLYISKNTFSLSLGGYRCKPGFPLREKFDWAFMVLFETGIIFRWTTIRDHVFARETAKYDILNYVDYRPIIISDLIFAFIFLIIGNCMGLICFFIEISFKNRCNKLKMTLQKHTNFASIAVQPYY